MSDTRDTSGTDGEPVSTVVLRPTASDDLMFAFGLASVRDPDWLRLHHDRLEHPDAFEQQLFAGVHESFIVTTSTAVGMANSYRADPEAGSIWIEVVMIPEFAGSAEERESIRALFERCVGDGYRYVLVQSVVSAQPNLPGVGVTRVCHLPDHLFADGLYWDVVVDALVAEVA